VHAVGPGFRSAATGGEVAVADGAEGLAQLLGGRVVTVEEHRPRVVRGRRDPRIAAEQIRQPLQDLAHPVRTVDRELGRRPPITLPRVAHDDADPGRRQGPERIFTGEVVADVDRHGVACAADVLEYPSHRPSLVPLDVGAQFGDLASVRDAERAVPAGRIAHRREDLAHPVRGDVAVMNGDGETLGFHQNAGHVGQAVPEGDGDPPEVGHRTIGGLVPVVRAVRTHELEAVVTRVPEAGHADPCLQVGHIAAADHADRAVSGEPGEFVRRAVDEGGRTGIVHEVGEGAVEVQEHGVAAGAQHGGRLVPGCQRVRDLRQPAVVGARFDRGPRHRPGSDDEYMAVCPSAPLRNRPTGVSPILRCARRWAGAFRSPEPALDDHRRTPAAQAYARTGTVVRIQTSSCSASSIAACSWSSSARACAMSRATPMPSGRSSTTPGPFARAVTG